MNDLFISVLNMSFTGSLLIMLVLIARLPLKKAPKIYSYLLWLVPMFRLIFPFSIESAYSLIPVNPKPIPNNIALTATPQINTGIVILNNNINAPLSSHNITDPLQIWLRIACLVWLSVMVLMLIYTLVSYVKLKLLLSRHSENTEQNIYISDKIDTAFVIGLFRHKIYLPKDIDVFEKELIILHEKTHIKRLDCLVKFVSWLICTIHWFNPLVWLAYILMEKDMEMSCDEAIIAKVGIHIKKEYSSSLLHLSSSVSKNRLPVFFGRTSIKDRINNILSYKKPSVIIGALLIAAVTVFGIICILSPEQAPVSTLNTSQPANTPEQTEALKQPISPEQTENDFYVLIAGEKMVTSIRKTDFTDWLNTLELSETEKPPHIDEMTKNLIVYAADSEYAVYNDYTMAVKNSTSQHYYTISKENYDQLFFYYAIRSNVYPYGSKKQPDNFKYTGDDPLLQLLYATEMSNIPNEGFKVASIKVMDYCLEENKLKAFIVVDEETYKTDGNEVMIIGGSVMCKAVTFTGDKIQSGGYIDVNNYISVPAEVVNSSDGSLWAPSIEAFCTTPVTGKEIKGLANKIISYYSNRPDLQKTQREHLIQTLNENGFKDMYLVTTYDNSREKLN